MAFDDGKKTVSGSIAHTDDAATKVPFVSVKCVIEPTLSGVSEVTVTQTGRNLVALNVSPQQAKRDYGVTVNTQTADTLNITSTGVAYACERLFYSFKKGTYAVKFLATSSDSFTPVISIYRTNGTGVKFNIQSNTVTTFTLAEDTDLDIRLFASGGGDTTVRTVEFSYFQIEVGSTVSTYSQYNSTVYTVSLGRTVYGATPDVVNGTGKDNRLKYELDETDSWGAYSGTTHSFWHNVATGEDRPIKQTEVTTSICNELAYSSNTPATAPDFSFCIQDGQRIVVTADSTIDTVDKFKTWLSSHNLVFVCPATTPTDFTFTPITPTPETVGKVNNVYCNTGNTEVTYYDNAHGFSEVTVNKNGVSQTAYLHKVIYGGQADVIRGQGTSTYKHYDLSDLTWSGGVIGGKMWCWYVDLSADGLKLPLNSAIFSGDCEDYTPIRFNVVGSTENTIALRDNGRLYVNDGSDTVKPTGSVIIEFATPETFTFPPISMSTDEGENTLFANEGDSAITYRKAVD